MPEPTIISPLGEPYLGDQARLDPVMTTSARRAHGERRGRAAERLELVPQLLEGLRIEARSDFRDVDEAVAFVDAQVERAEVAARALGVVV